jgi:UDPglucose 6-dehydrogenase
LGTGHYYERSPKKRFTDNIICTLHNTVADKKITLLGWAFKKETNDTRESAAIYVADHLLNEKVGIAIYDPKVTEEQMNNDLTYLQTRTEMNNTKWVPGSLQSLQRCSCYRYSNGIG